jgi:hypothetical protein
MEQLEQIVVAFDVAVAIIAVLVATGIMGG